jgi:hypothetical protein
MENQFWKTFGGRIGLGFGSGFTISVAKCHLNFNEYVAFGAGLQ